MFSKFNIEKNLDDKAEQKDELLENNTEKLPNHHFSQLDLDKIWSHFLNEIKNQDIVVYSAINNFSFKKISEDTIEVYYPSKSSKDKFLSVEKDFIYQLKHKTQNFSISLDFKLDPILKQEIITSKNIFDKYVEINPLLKELDQLVKFDFN